MAGKGAHIKKGDPVEKTSTEGPLDQNIGISVDPAMTDVVYLGSVIDENDVFKRCPVTGSLDFAKEEGKDSLKSLMEKLSDYTSNVYINPTGDGFKPIGEAESDRFGVNDSKWIDDPEDLIWKSTLLSQLQAKLNAVTHFLNDPSTLDFGGSMSDEDKKVVAQRARELAASLQDEALNAVDAKTDEAQAALSRSIAETKGRYMKYTVTSKEAKQKGGLTEDEVNELFQGGQ